MELRLRLEPASILDLPHPPFLGVEGGAVVLVLGAMVLDRAERNKLERSTLFCHNKSSDFKRAAVEPVGCRGNREAPEWQNGGL